MKLIYLDEAGNTGRKRDPDQPIHMIGFLIVDESKVRDIEVEIGKIAAITLWEGVEKPAIFQAWDIEFHGVDLFRGNGVFNGLPPANRIKCALEIIDVLIRNECVYRLCAVDKIKLYSSNHPHMLCFQFVLERIQDYLRDCDSRGLLVADEHRELEEQLIKDLAFSKEFTTQWGYRPTAILNIVDTVHFVKSRHNRLIQATDVLTYFRLKAMRVEQRIAAAWAAETGKSDFVAFRASILNASDKAVMTIGDKVRVIERYNKVWPN